MNLILITDKERGARGEVRLTDQRADHIRDVLKARAGDSLRVGQLNGPVGTGMIKAIQPEAVTVRCLFKDQTPPPRPSVDLLLALPRPKIMKRLWAALATLGVGRIILTNAQKVERYYFDSHVLEPDFYRAELRKGLEQAMDTCLPEVHIARQLKPLLEDELDELCPDTHRIVADPSEHNRISSALRGSKGRRVLLAVGPEGGWSNYELDLLKGRGMIPAALGPRILRTDTACIALLAMAHDVAADEVESAR